MIIDLQQRLAEVGRIRIGHQVATKDGKKRPAKLDTIRLTSPDRRRVEQAAELYGGAAGEWQAPSGSQWEVVTEATTLDIIVPPASMAFSQHYEQWGSGGCLRRCDGVREHLSDGGCLCDPDSRDCEIHSRLSVMLRDLPGLGVWRLDTQGYYAAVELGATVQVLQAAAGRGQMLPARLRLEQRSVKRQGQPAHDFVVPVLDLDVSPGQLLAAASGAGPALAGPVSAQAIAAGASPHLTPVPESVPQRPVSPIAQQAAAVYDESDAPQRRNAQAPIPATGVKPRPAAEAGSTGAPDLEHERALADLDAAIAAADVDDDKARKLREEMAATVWPDHQAALADLDAAIAAADVDDDKARTLREFGLVSVEHAVNAAAKVRAGSAGGA